MFGTPFRAVKRCNPVPGQHVAIWGAGPIGLTAPMIAKRYGVKVAVMDHSTFRLGMAKGFEADLIVNGKMQDVCSALKGWTDGRGVDVALDCVGHRTAAKEALGALRKRGTLCVVGVSRSLALDPWHDLICQEFTAFGTRHFNAFEFEGMTGMVRSGVPIERIVTHRFPISGAVEAFDVFKTIDKCGKILSPP